jgi:hypothetical protein
MKRFSGMSAWLAADKPEQHAAWIKNHAKFTQRGMAMVDAG